MGRVPPLPAAAAPRAGDEDTQGLEELAPLDNDSGTDDQVDAEVGVLSVTLNSTALMSFFSSATFHLLLLGTAIVVSPLLGLDWLPHAEDRPSQLMAALGDADVVDDLPLFEFSGDLSAELETPASSLQQLAATMPSDSGSLMAGSDNVLKSVFGTETGNPDDEGAGVLLKVPRSGLAVTKGSFTAFTIPANPKPRESYSIVIEIRLPDDVKTFRVSDLTGEVRGSDRYSQKLPYDSRAPYASGYPSENQRITLLDKSTSLDVVKNRVQIVVRVPGAERLVKDEIRIRSRRLKEEQELTLVFGARSDQPDTKVPEVDESNTDSKTDP